MPYNLISHLPRLAQYIPYGVSIGNPIVITTIITIASELAVEYTNSAH